MDQCNKGPATSHTGVRSRQGEAGSYPFLPSLQDGREQLPLDLLQAGDPGLRKLQEPFSSFHSSWTPGGLKPQENMQTLSLLGETLPGTF